jgi:hypothetical protein
MTRKMDRRTIVMGAAWALPVIAAATAIPAATASSASPELPPRQPVSCEYLGNQGHDGPKGGAWWFVTYSDGSTATLDNGTVKSDRALRSLCQKQAG